MRIKRPLFRSRRTALVVGAAGAMLFWLGMSDAYEGRGGQQPRALRPFSFW